VKIVVGHLFPDYLNIYADRGNMAVLERRAAWRGHELEVLPLGGGAEILPGVHDLFYVGGGQDREQELIAPALADLGDALREAVAGGAAALAVCGGYQLLSATCYSSASSFRVSRARSQDSRTMPAERTSTRGPSRSVAYSPASGTTERVATRAAARAA
jgi:CobQ-like glutamine amidotransferase family enzyme